MKQGFEDNQKNYFKVFLCQSLQLQKETPYRQTILCYKICHVSHKHLTDFSGGYTRKIAFQDDNLRIKIILLLYHFKAVYGTARRHGGE